MQNAKDKFPESAERLVRTDELIRLHFGSAWVEEDEFVHFVDLIKLPDLGDRHVVAAAIACKASYIVTDNLKHFPNAELQKFGLEAGLADKFLSGTFEHYKIDAFNDLRNHRAGLSSQPSPSEYLMLLRSRGLPLLASQLQPMKSFL